MTDLPTEIAVGKIVGRFRIAVVDSADGGSAPDAQPAVGGIRVESTQPYRRVLEPEPETIGTFSGVFDLDSEGYLVDAQGTRGVWLPVGFYAIHFAIKKLRISPVVVEVTELHTEEDPLDLAVAIPPVGAPVSEGQYADLSDRLEKVELAATHSALPGLDEDDHPQYARTDGTRGAFATVAQGAKADTAVQPAALAPYATDAELAAHAADTTSVHGIANTANLVLTNDPRLSDARTPTAHTQSAATITDLTETVQDIVAAFLVAGTNVTVTYNDVANTFTINAAGGSGGGGETDPEIVRDVIGAAMVAGSGIQINVNDAGDTITIASTAVLPTRQVTAGTGLTGGGDLSANRSFAVDFAASGTTSTTKAVRADDSRLSDSRTPLTHSHAEIEERIESLTVNVKDFGAVGDGVTNDSAAIAAAIASTRLNVTVGVAGGDIYFPPGQYRIESSIDLDQFSGTLRGAGRGNSPTFASNPGGATVLKWEGAAGEPMVLIRDSSDVRIADMRFEGKTTALPSYAIECRAEAGDGAGTNGRLVFERLHIGDWPWATSGGTATRCAVGIGFTGVNANNDQFKLSEVSVIGCAIGLDVKNTQSIWGIIFNSVFGSATTAGIRSAAAFTGTNLQFDNCEIDIQTVELCNVVVHGWWSERSGLIFQATFLGSLTVVGGKWLLDSASLSGPQYIRTTYHTSDAVLNVIGVEIGNNNATHPKVEIRATGGGHNGSDVRFIGNTFSGTQPMTTLAQFDIQNFVSNPFCRILIDQAGLYVRKVLTGNQTFDTAMQTVELPRARIGTIHLRDNSGALEKSTDGSTWSAVSGGGGPDPTGATDGHVWTADGAGGAAWEAPSGGGGGDGWTYYVNSSESTNDTTTYVNASGLSIPAGVTAGTYEIKAFIVSKLSASGQHGYQLTKPNVGALSLVGRGARGAGEVWQYASSQAGGNITITPNNHPNAVHSAPGAVIEGTLYLASGTTGTAMNITFAPGTAGTLMTIMLGSYIAIRKIA